MKLNEFIGYNSTIHKFNLEIILSSNPMKKIIFKNPINAIERYGDYEIRCWNIEKPLLGKITLVVTIWDSKNMRHQSVKEFRQLLDDKQKQKEFVISFVPTLSYSDLLILKYEELEKYDGYHITNLDESETTIVLIVF